MFGISLTTPITDSRGFSIDISAHGDRLAGPAGLRAALLKHGRHVSPELDAAVEDPSILVDAYKSRLLPSELAELEDQVGSTPVSGRVDRSTSLKGIRHPFPTTLYVQ